MLVIKDIEEVKKSIGQEIGVSDWLQIDQDRINTFADATGDHQWIHVDVEKAAAEMPDGKTIAHGYLTLSLVPGLTFEFMDLSHIKNAINYGSNRIRFTNTVPVGSRIRARSVVKSVEEKAGGMQVINEITVEIEGQDRPACIAETVTLFFV